MRIGFIGAGKVTRTLSRHLIGAGHTGVDPCVETGKNRDSCGWLLKTVQQ